MIIQNTNVNQGASHTRLVSDNAPNAITSKAVVSAPEQTAKQPSSHQLNNAVNAVNQAMRQSSQSLEFSVDTSTKKSIVKMVDTSTGELVRQIPSKEMLAIAQSIDDFLQRQGLLLSQKA
jgi:flagellar protein FlaG